MDYSQLTSTELILRLQGDEGVRRALEARLGEAAERERLMRELQLHQQELEAQNETLRTTQRELEESRNRYVDLYDFAPIPYFTFDRNCVIREVNLPGANLLGKDRASVLGHPLIGLVRIEDPVSFSSHIRHCLTAAGPIAGEVTLSTRRGTREFQLLSTAVRDARGASATCRTAFLDVTERRLAERQAQSMHASERALSARLEGIDRAAAAANAALAKLSGADIRDFLQVIVDRARAAVDAEYAALGIAGAADGTFDPWVFAGVSAEQVAAIGRTPRAVGLLGEVVNSGQPMRLRDLREHAASSGWPAQHPQMTSFLGVPIRYQGQSRGNLYLANKRRGGEFTDEDQMLVEMLADRAGVAMEIARLRQTEAREHAAAKISADRLSSAVESIEDALALYDADERLVLCNSAYRELVGRLVPGPITGKLYGDVLDAWLRGIVFESEDERSRFAAERLAERRELTRFELRTQDGRSLRVMNRPTVEGGIVQTIWDLSADVEHARELSEARETAEAASAAKSDFLSSMSHELRTPLNSILGFAQLLQRDKKTPLSERQQERVAHVLTGGEHLLKLIDEVLDLAHIEAGRVTVSPEPVAIAEVLAEVVTTLGPMAAGGRIEIATEELPADFPSVLADRTRLQQILMNFGSNATKYGREGGKTIFRTVEKDGFARISVIDDGMGIAEDQHAKIFQPFQRAGQEAGPIQGTGIGLAITKRLAELMGGRLGFNSQSGQGSEFWIDLPVYRKGVSDRPRSGAEGRKSSALAGSEGRRFLIVYIEDNPSNIAFMHDLIADFDRIELLTAASAELGLELVRARRPDLVIMDINLPGMNGLDATKRLREWPETSDIPVIGLSAAAMVRDAKRVQTAGFHRYLTKPVRVDELTRALEELLAPRPAG